MRLPALALANLLLAGGIVGVGLPGILADFRRLPAEVTVGAVERGQPVDEAAIEDALPALEGAAATSPAAREDLALTLLAGAGGDRAAERLDRAEQEFRAYLTEVPGDSRGWASLAEAELRLGAWQPAQEALKMSILTAPSMPGLLLARCAMAIDLYAVLDRETRGLVKEQFRIAADRSPRALAQLAWQKHAILIARIMLADSPEGMASFEGALARL